MNPRSRNNKKNEFEQWCLNQFNKAYNFGKWDLAVPCSSFVGPDIVVNSDLSTEVMKYAPEAKRQETLNLTAWWQQCTTNANKFNLEPVLLFRQNNNKAVVIITRCHFHNFGLNNLGRYTEVKQRQFHAGPPRPVGFEPITYLRKCDTDLVMIRASEFFRLIDKL